MINWKVTEQEADYILRCLMARPYSEVNSLINKLMGQANEKKSAPPPADHP
jgi:hypothetical protein